MEFVEKNMADARFWTQQCYVEQEKEEEKIIL